jgi:hypothetical protein
MLEATGRCGAGLKTFYLKLTQPLLLADIHQASRALISEYGDGQNR